MKPRRLVGAVGMGAALLLAVEVALPAVAANATWTQVGYNSGHTGYNKTEKDHQREERRQAGECRKLRYPGARSSTNRSFTRAWSTPGRVTAISNAFNQRTGAVVWSIGNYQSPIGANWGMAAADDKLVVNCVNGDNTSGL